MSRLMALCLLGLAAVGLLGQVSSAWAQSPQLSINVYHTFNDSAGPQPLVGVEIFIDHPLDSLAGLELWLKIDSTLPVRFKMVSEGNPAYSISGSPVTGYEYFSVKSLRGDGTDVKIVGLAEGNFVPPFRRGFAPGYHLLLRLELRILGGADTLPQPLGAIQIDTTPEHFGFSDPNGNAIGITNGQLDTNLVKFHVDSVAVSLGDCAAAGDIDNNGLALTLADLLLVRDLVQGRAPIPNYLFMADFTGDCRVDSADVSLLEKYFQQGITALLPYPRPTCCYQSLIPCCEGTVGNVDCDPGQGVDISDLTVMIDGLFISISDPCCFGEADIDRSAGIDISDLTLLIDALFISLTPLPNCPLVGAGPLRAMTDGQ